MASVEDLRLQVGISAREALVQLIRTRFRDDLGISLALLTDVPVLAQHLGVPKRVSGPIAALATQICGQRLGMWAMDALFE